MAFTQDGRGLAINTELGANALLLTEIRGSEGVSVPFAFELEVLAESPNPGVERLLRRPVGVRISQRRPGGGTETRHLHGIVTGVTDLGYVPLPTTSGRARAFTLELRPWLWMLSRSSGFRVFQPATVPDIVKMVFTEMGLTDFEARLSRTYQVREFCLQYDETSLNFVSRLLEHEGIFYFFEHTASSHKLVLLDDVSSAPTVSGEATIRFARSQGEAALVPSVANAWETIHRVRSDRFTLDDYDFRMPEKELRVSRQSAQPAFERYDYPGLYEEVADGEALAQVRLEEESSFGWRVTGTTSCVNLVPGHAFALTEHPVASFNASYVGLTASHVMSEPYASDTAAIAYSNTVHALPAGVPFRPPRTATIPLARGLQTAVVVGKPGDEITVDRYGRIHVQFHWDREGVKDEKSSCFIRVGQTWAARRWGGLVLPRVGQEVIVEFENGNPDRPLITGCVYNGDNLPPYDLPAHGTRSTFKTNSSKGGGGSNELRFEDKAGSEQIYLNAQKDFDTAVEQDIRGWVGRDTHLTVTKNRHEEIGGQHHLKVGTDHVVQVGGSASQKSATSTVVEAGTEVYVKSGAKVVIEAGATLTLKAAGSFVQIDPSGVTVQGPLVRINSGGAAVSAGASSKSPTKPDAVKREG